MLLLQDIIAYSHLGQLGNFGLPVVYWSTYTAGIGLTQNFEPRIFINLYAMIHGVCVYIYIYIYKLVSDRIRGQPESLFDGYYIEVQGWTLLLSTYPWSALFNAEC